MSFLFNCADFFGSNLRFCAKLFDKLAKTYRFSIIYFLNLLVSGLFCCCKDALTWIH